MIVFQPSFFKGLASFLGEVNGDCRRRHHHVHFVEFYLGDACTYSFYKWNKPYDHGTKGSG